MSPVLKRLIPVILLKGDYAYASRNFSEYTYLGDPINIAKVFSDKMADELSIIDVGASKREGPINHDLLQKLSRNAFVPMAYGGGIKSATDAVSIIRLGFERITINSIFLDSPQVVREIADSIGQSSVTVEITVKMSSGTLVPMDFRTGELLSLPLMDQVTHAIECGAGEVLIKSVSGDGDLSIPSRHEVLATPRGIKAPILYGGGVSCLEDVMDLWQAGFDGVTAGTWLSLRGRLRAPMIHYPSSTSLDSHRLSPSKKDG